jgi:hypothetical protein
MGILILGAIGTLASILVTGYSWYTSRGKHRKTVSV